jgi:hypothetical protein
MLIKMPRHLAALALALAMFLQGLGLVFMDKLTTGQTIQWLAVSLAIAALTHEAWRNRNRLDHRVDMAIVMIAFGGLAMLVGMNVDHALAPGNHASPHVMHGSSSQSESMPGMADMNHTESKAGDAHASPRSGLTWTSFKTALFSWMTGLMLLGGIPPTWFMTRCARLAGRDWRRWIATHIFGNVGMVIGMIVFGKLFGAALSMKLGVMMTGRHLAMLVGMFVGMELLQFVAEAILGLKPWQKLDVPVDEKSLPEKNHSTEPIKTP